MRVFYTLSYRTDRGFVVELFNGIHEDCIFVIAHQNISIHLLNKFVVSFLVDLQKLEWFSLEITVFVKHYQE
jgi:hypothetical protein